MKLPRKLSLPVVFLLALLLAGCGRNSQEATATPTKTPPVEQAVEVATATPQPPAEPVEVSAPVVEEPAPEVEPVTAPEPEPDPEIATITATQLNIRSQPSTSGDIVRLVDQGAQFEVVGRSEDGQWLEVAEDDQLLGWIVAEFATVSGGSVADTGDEAAGDSAGETAASEPAPQPAAPSGDGSYLPATMNSPDFGGQAFLWWREEVAHRDLDLMKDANFSWVKQTFAWETIEAPVKGQFDWSIADRVVQQADESGLKLLARLSSDPDLKDKFWGGKPPANTANFADFAFAVASRYNCTPAAVGCIQAYQVWNEPNLAREWGDNPPNPAQYAEFLRTVYAAIKRGNPNAIVVSAGMAPTGDNNAIAMPDDLFYDGMYQAMGGNSNGYFDMLGVHGAGFAAPPELDPAEAASNPQYGGYRFFAFRHVEDIRRIMEKYGDTGKKIVLLEFGWTYDPVNPSYKWHGADAGIDAFVQADYLKRAYQWADANWQPWIGLMSLLTMPNIDWLDDGNPQDEEQYWWAIMDPYYPDSHWRPAYIELCIYFNGVAGQACKYDPN
jgi:hypothetical protein